MQSFNFAQVEMKVNKLTSVKTQLPYEYYSLPVCKPATVLDKAENLGEVLSGDRIENSLYDLRMGVNAQCRILCKSLYSPKQTEQFISKIADEYRVHWIIDNLPSAIRVYDDEDPTKEYYENGYPLGMMAPDANGQQMYYLYNHIRFVIQYHKDSASYEGSRVVGFIVQPFSVKHKYDQWNEDTSKVSLSTCNKGKPVDHTMEPMLINSKLSSSAAKAAAAAKADGKADDATKAKDPSADQIEVVWTYDVTWEPSETAWASRWDVFLSGSPDDQIHWFSIVNSLMIVLFLTGMVAMIMMRTLHKDIARYNEEVTQEEAQEETGWKLVHGDVFRPPQFSPMLLAVFTGTGCQLMAMSLILMVFAVFGFLSPANRGGLMTALLLLFVFMGLFAGYVSAQLYKMFGGKKWTKNIMMTALVYPGIIFFVFFVVNLFVWHTGSSGAVPFTTMFALLVMWFGISVPLVLVGSYFGFKKEEIKHPCRFNQIPRQVPEQMWYMHPLFSVLVGGILPFGAVFIELFFIMSSIWLHRIYYVFGFLLIVLFILVATCAEITMVMCYFQLCSEDYHWWWRSFLTSGSSSFYLFLYAILYYVTKLDITKVSCVLSMWAID
jgi:transmembrane 9 superfamily protein 2/4